MRIWCHDDGVLASPRRSLRVLGHTVTGYLAYARPYEWPAMLAFFRARAIDGIERVDRVAGRDRYVRSFVHADAPGTVEIVHAPVRARFAVTIRCADRSAVPAVLAR